MAYLLEEDFKKHIQELFLEEIIEGDDTLLADAIGLAEEEVYSCISQRYDAEAEFAKTTTARNPKVLQCAVDIAIYHLVSRVTPNQVPANRNDRYLDAVEWLTAVSNGQRTPRLDIKVDENTGDQTALFRMGSNEKFKSEY
jgi:phage gp36-like protein